MTLARSAMVLLLTGLSTAAAMAADWPQYGGPDGTWTADAGDHTYLRDWSQARLVWQSEVGDIGTGRGQAPRYGARNAIPEGTGTFGGTASPIIADGRLYLYYVRPIGTAFNRSVVEKIQTDHGEREGFSRELLERNFSLELENVLVAIDLESGATLWEQTSRGVHSHGDFAKPRDTNNTPAAGDGRVFVLGYDYVLRAHDGATGELLWQTNPPENDAEDLALLISNETTFIRTEDQRVQARMCYAPAVRYVDGVVLYAPGSSSLIARDGATGEELWRADGATDRVQAIPVWRREVGTCVITVSRGGTVACLDVRSGERLWELTGKGATIQPIIAGDLLLINETNSGGGQPVAQLGCYRMSDTGAEQLWVNEDEAQLSHARAPARAFHNGRFIVGGWAGPRVRGNGKQERAAIRFFDAETGAVDDSLRRLPLGEGAAATLAPDSMITVVGNLLYIENDSHHSSNPLRTIVDLSTNEVIVQYTSPVSTAAAYGGTVINQPIVDGRLYLRGNDGHIHCYDVTQP